MPSPRKKIRAGKRPQADETCSLVRSVRTPRLRINLWTCTAPTPATLPPAEPLRAAPVERIERIGRRNWRLYYVSPVDAEREDALVSEPGWYIEAVNPSASWISADPLGPYATLKELREDAIEAIRSGE